jgi:hypothetical protein
MKKSWSPRLNKWIELVFTTTVLLLLMFILMSFQMKFFKYYLSAYEKGENRLQELYEERGGLAYELALLEADILVNGTHQERKDELDQLNKRLVSNKNRIDSFKSREEGAEIIAVRFAGGILGSLTLPVASFLGATASRKKSDSPAIHSIDSANYMRALIVVLVLAHAVFLLAINIWLWN